LAVFFFPGGGRLRGGIAPNILGLFFWADIPLYLLFGTGQPAITWRKALWAGVRFCGCDAGRWWRPTRCCCCARTGSPDPYQFLSTGTMSGIILHNSQPFLVKGSTRTRCVLLWRPAFYPVGAGCPWLGSAAQFDAHEGFLIIGVYSCRWPTRL